MLARQPLRTVNPVSTRRHSLRQLAALGGLAWLGCNDVLAGQLPTADDGETAAEDGTESESILSYVDPKTQRYRCGLELSTGRANCRNIITTFPLPRIWPEQKVQLVESQIDPVFRRWQERDLNGLASQFVAQIGALPAGSFANALFTFEITRYRIVPSQEVASLQIPRRVDRDMRQFMISSPYIDVGSARVRAAVREIEAQPAVNDWQRVEQIYDWVREKIAYVEGDIKSADDALKDGTGDCEELTSAFVAICRTLRIPARMVHVLLHCYPEFYLEDAEGNGHWIPCQVAGTRQFGSMEEYRPILQKGDRFKTPEQPLRRYVAEYFKAAAVQGGNPSPKFVQELLD